MENDALFKDIFKAGFIKSTEGLLESFHQGYIDEEDYANLLEELVKTYKEFFSSSRTYLVPEEINEDFGYMTLDQVLKLAKQEGERLVFGREGSHSPTYGIDKGELCSACLLVENSDVYYLSSACSINIGDLEAEDWIIKGRWERV